MSLLWVVYTTLYQSVLDFTENKYKSVMYYIFLVVLKIVTVLKYLIKLTHDVKKYFEIISKFLLNI